MTDGSNKGLSHLPCLMHLLAGSSGRRLRPDPGRTVYRVCPLDNRKLGIGCVEKTSGIERMLLVREVDLRSRGS